MADQLSRKLIGFLQKQDTDNKFVEVVKGNPRVKSLPDMIRRNGLVQTVLFLQGKSTENKKSKDGPLLHLLHGCVGVCSGQQQTEPANWVKELTALSTPKYLHQMEVAIVCATWISRMADAMDVAAPQKTDDRGKS